MDGEVTIATMPIVVNYRERKDEQKGIKLWSGRTIAATEASCLDGNLDLTGGWWLDGAVLEAKVGWTMQDNGRTEHDRWWMELRW